MNNQQKIIELLKSCSNPVIAGHVHPDGDAIGSCLAMANALHSMGKTPTALLEAYGQKYNCIPGREFLDKNHQANGQFVNSSYDLVIVLDCSTAKRLGNAGPVLGLGVPVICIDHHTNGDMFGDYNYIIPESPSTCELVYDILVSICELDKNIASCLYAGILDDTGGFRHNSTNPKTMEIAAKLMALDIPFSRIYNELMTAHSLANLKLLGRALERAEILDKYSVITTCINQDDLIECNAVSADTEGIVDYLICTRNAEIAVFVYSKGNDSKVSMRSIDFDLVGIAKKHGGGGHPCAAGYSYEGSVAEGLKNCVDEIIGILNDSGRKGGACRS